MGYGRRQVLSEMLVPFKAAVQLGGARGVMMYIFFPLDKPLQLMTSTGLTMISTVYLAPLVSGTTERHCACPEFCVPHSRP
jgi:hypothetical protein